MSAEDDFGLWERELKPEIPRVPNGSASGRGMIAAAAVVAAGCTMLITLGQAPLGAAGLILSSLILLLWRIGM